MDCFLERHKQGEIESLKSPVSTEEIEFVIKNSSKRKMPDPDDLIGKLSQTFLETIIPILFYLSYKIEGPFSISFYVTSITLIPK